MPLTDSIVHSRPFDVPARPEPFVVREEILRRCRAAWSLRSTTHGGGERRSSQPPAFRLVGPAGAGKNEIVHELVRESGAELHVIQGHEDLAPEDLALSLVPGARSEAGGGRLVVRASPLATAIWTGAVFLLDDANRVPERTLAQLASVLDDRRALYSAVMGHWIRPRDPVAEDSFRFCCAMDDEQGNPLPDYIAQRCGPVIRVGHLAGPQLATLIPRDPRGRHERFCRVYLEEERREEELRRIGIMLRALERMAYPARCPGVESQWQALLREAERDLLADPGDRIALNERAHWMMELGMLEQALEVVEEALALRPWCGFASCTRGDIHVRLGNEREARASYLEVIRSDPGNETACDHARARLKWLDERSSST